MNLLLAFVIGVGSFCPPGERKLHVDLIEVNHRYAYTGEYIASQVIVWERMPETGRFVSRGFTNYPDVVEWPIRVEDMVYTSLRPNSEVIHVRARLYRESWTQDDPERESKRYQRAHGIVHVDLLATPKKAHHDKD